MLSIQLNLPSLTAWRNLKNTVAEQQRASNRLSSGFRVNSAADDAAGLAISENMRAQIRGLDRAYKNTRDGHALLTTMDGGLDSIGAMLIRKRELTIQALNDTYTTEQRRMIQLEVTQLIREIDHFANRLEFNGMTLLNRRSALQGSLRMPNVHSGMQSGITLGSIPFPILNADFTTHPSPLAPHIFGHTLQINFMGLPGFSSNNIATMHIPQGFNATVSTMGIWGYVSIVSPSGTIFGNHPGASVGFGSGITNTQYGQLELAAGTLTPGGYVINAGIMLSNVTSLGVGDWIIKYERREGIGVTASGIRASVEPGSDFVIDEPGELAIFPDIWLQVGANSMQGINIPTFDARAAALGVDGLNILSHSTANAAIRAIDNALDQVNGFHAIIGANMNRLDHTGRSLLISSENLQDAESRIRNADMAKEMIRFTMANVLQQAGVGVLAQANRGKDVILQLLR